MLPSFTTRVSILHIRAAAMLYCSIVSLPWACANARIETALVLVFADDPVSCSCNGVHKPVVTAVALVHW
jgi:hypothetical protein